MLDLKNVTLVGIDGAGTNNNITKALSISKKNINFFDTLLLSPIDTYDKYTDGINIIHIDKMTYEEWNKFTIKELYKYIKTSHYLFADVDGFIINPHLWTDDFLKYDYIGAPWVYPDHIFTKHVDEKIKQQPKDSVNLVGNGGFTLRSVKIGKLLENCSDTRYSPEDVYICQNNYDYLISNGIKFAPAELARIFSQDPLTNTTNTFGFHGNKQFINQIKD